MPGHANVKPLTHWIIYKGYQVRFKDRAPDAVTGILTTEEGEIEFRYDPVAMQVFLPDRTLQINEHGWELGAPDGQQDDA